MTRPPSMAADAMLFAAVDMPSGPPPIWIVKGRANLSRRVCGPLQ